MDCLQRANCNVNSSEVYLRKNKHRRLWWVSPLRKFAFHRKPHNACVFFIKFKCRRIDNHLVINMTNGDVRRRSQGYSKVTRIILWWAHSLWYRVLLPCLCGWDSQPSICELPLPYEVVESCSVFFSEAPLCEMAAPGEHCAAVKFSVLLWKYPVKALEMFQGHD